MKKQSRFFSQFIGISRVAFLSWIILIVILAHFATLAHSAEVTLVWDPNIEAELVGYKIYYGFETGNYVYSIDVGNVTSYAVTGLEENQTIYFAATAYDVNGHESDYSKEVIFKVENQPPVADAGPDQTVDESTVTNLSGINSSDPEGWGLSYFWEQTGGSIVVLSDPETAQPNFTTPDVGMNGESLTFKLTVIDDNGLQAEDYCTINVSWVNIPPTADAVSDIIVNEGEEVILDGFGSSDSDDGLATYLWEQTGGPGVYILNPTDVQASFIAPDLTSEGVSLTFKLTVQDNGGLIASDTCVVNVTWLNTPPTANAGQDQSVSESDMVILDGSASMDPDDGIASIRWTQTGGTPVTMSDPTTRQPKFIAPAVSGEGQTLTFQLTITDMAGLTSQDTCVVIVNSQIQIVPPTLDIKANGQDGLVSVRRYSPVSISISIDPRDLRGETVDLWLVVDAPNGRFFYVYENGWQGDPMPFIQYPLDERVSHEAFNIRLPKGDYSFHFAIDDNADGLPDGTWLDTVSVKVQ